MPQDRTGFTELQRTTILRRSYGWCELCNRAPVAHIHHRKPRRMGGVHRAGDLDVNRVANGLALCNTCHDRVERDRANSIDKGLLLASNASPIATPAHLPRYQGWVLLDDAGDVHWHPTYEKARAAGLAADSTHPNH